MLSKEQFISLVSRSSSLSSSEIEDINNQFESANDAAITIEAAMPAIGLFSVQKRLNAFFAVCRHLDQLIENESINKAEAQLSLLILRLSNKSFLKAATMFDIRGNRYDARHVAEMPRTASEYLAGLRKYG